MFRKEQIHREEKRSTGAGYLFIGEANTAYASANLKCVGAIDPETGYEWTPTDEFYDHFDGDPKKLQKRETTKIGRELSFVFTELFAGDELLKIFGYGTSSTSAANTSTAFTSEEVTLYCDRPTKLHNEDVTITSISDDEATPNIYTGSDITDNFRIDSTNGLIQLKSSGSISPSKDGLVFYITGTYEKPAETILTVGNESTEKSYYALMLKLPEPDGNYKKIVWYKAYPGEIETFGFKAGEARTGKCTFNVAQDPAQTGLEVVYDSKPS